MPDDPLRLVKVVICVYVCLAYPDARKPGSKQGIDNLVSICVSITPYIDRHTLAVGACASAPLPQFPRLAAIGRIEHERYSGNLSRKVEHLHRALLHILQ